MTPRHRVECAGVDGNPMIEQLIRLLSQQMKIYFARPSASYRMPGLGTENERIDFVFRFDVDRRIVLQHPGQAFRQAGYPALPIGRVEKDDVELRSGRNQVL